MVTAVRTNSSQKSHLIGKWLEHIQIQRAVSSTSYVGLKCQDVGGKDTFKLTVLGLCTWVIALGERLKPSNGDDQV